MSNATHSVMELDIARPAVWHEVARGSADFCAGYVAAISYPHRLRHRVLPLVEGLLSAGLGDLASRLDRARSLGYQLRIDSDCWYARPLDHDGEDDGTWIRGDERPWEVAVALARLVGIDDADSV